MRLFDFPFSIEKYFLVFFYFYLDFSETREKPLRFSFQPQGTTLAPRLRYRLYRTLHLNQLFQSWFLWYENWKAGEILNKEPYHMIHIIWIYFYNSSRFAENPFFKTGFPYKNPEVVWTRFPRTSERFYQNNQWRILISALFSSTSLDLKIVSLMLNKNVFCYGFYFR